jgi:hypothetical protein
MKIPRLEAMRRSQREYHRSHPWRLSAGGFYVPHSYEDRSPDKLTHWDDVGFILNGRRVIVWWEHPRYVYGEALWDRVWKEVGDGPRDNWLTEGGTKNYKRVGRSRKKLVSRTLRSPSPEQSAHYDLLRATFARMSGEGIDLTIPASWKPQRLRWATGVNIVAPIEVRSEQDLVAVAILAKRLLKGETTINTEFPGYLYSRSDWLSDQVTPD